MNRKIWKALGIAVCMLALAAPRAMAETYKVGKNAPFIKFGDAVEAINKSGDTKNEIVLMQDITLGGDSTEYTLYTLSRGETTIKGGGNKITISNAGITVAKKGTVLNLGEEGYDGTLTIDGKTSGGFVSVLEGATANMYKHVTLQNWQFARNACVVIMGSDPATGSKSVFNMYGGVIEKCSRAVMVNKEATFNMSSGEIRNCVSMNDGGGLYANNSTINITGGIISGCEGRWGGGLYATNSSKITITGGTISGCTAAENGGGLYATNSSTITISDGTISGCSAGEGGGLYAKNSSAITIKGGTISKCTAPADNGGGLYADHSTVTISGGTISGCEGVWGGGLYAENSSTIEISGGTISGCKKVGAGGGLFVDSSTIRISGGIISGCITSDTGNGGGLYANHSTIKITGGRIENNKAAHGGGVALIGDTTFEDSITNWTVIGNEAYATGGVGGGIKLENGSMDVSDGLNRIYNNTAGGQGADIFLLGSSTIRLPNAANMGAKYHDSGIKIDNWYNDNPRYTPSESGEVVGAGVELKGGLSLVASYKASPVRIEIDANGGVGGSGSQTVQKGTIVTLEAPTKEGHLFTGWKDEKGNSYPAGADGKVNITVTEDMTLTAEWKKLPSALVRIEIDANGGVGGSGSQTVQKGKTVTLEAPTKERHLFTGWKDEKGNSYPAGADGKVNITVNEDMKLTAVWEARTFTVTYVLLNGETRTEKVDYGQMVTLSEEPRTGYTFVGWKDGEKMYHAGETITVTGDMTLTAEWKKLPSAENLPKTGDESPVLLWGAALAVSAAACFMLRRRK